MIDLCSIRKVQTAIRAFEAELKAETGLSLNDAIVLCAASKGMEDAASLSRELDLSPSRLTRILDSLVTRGLVSRTESPEDRRAISVSLTARGARLVAQYRETDIEVPAELARAAKKNKALRG